MTLEISNSPFNVRVYSGFESGKEFAVFGAEVSPAGPFILAVGPVNKMPLRFDVAMGGNDAVDAPTEYNASDPSQALAAAQAVVVKDGPMKDIGLPLPNPPGCAFVGCSSGQLQFRVGIDLNHDEIRNMKPGTRREFTLNTKILSLAGNRESGAAHGIWTAGHDVIIIVEAMGPLQIFSRPFAIDLGTTNTCAAWMPEDGGEPRLFQFGDGVGNGSVPTLLVYDDIPPDKDKRPRTYKIGVDAKLASAKGDMRRFVMGVKRYLGLPGNRGMLEVMAGNGLKKLPAKSIYQDFLKKYLEDFQSKKLRRLKRVKATYPPDYPARAFGAMQEVYTELKIETEKLLGIDEASAAAVWYVWLRLKNQSANRGLINVEQYLRLNGEQHNLLVFDVGGGTTDISLVNVTVKERTENNEVVYHFNLRVLSTASLMNIGGDLFTMKLLKAFKCRIAVAAAKFHKGNLAALESQSHEAAEALKKVFDELEHFEPLLLPLDQGGISPGNDGGAQKLQELYDLSEKIVPTQWVRFDHEPFRKKHAVNTYYILWRIAEELKIELCKQVDGEAIGARRAVPVDYRRFSGGGPEYTWLRLLGANEEQFWKDVKLDREVDLYRFIRGDVRKAVKACGYVMASAHGVAQDIDSIQLVGNSSKVPLIRDLMIEEFGKQIPGIKSVIRPIDDSAKSAVALGACLAAGIKDFGAKSRLRMEFEGLPERLGWEVGEYNHMDPFMPCFHATDKPADRPSCELDDNHRLDLTLYRRRPGQPESELQVLGAFKLADDAPETVTVQPPIPRGKIRLRVIPGGDIVLMKENKMWKMQRNSSDLDPRLDPFSGTH